MISEFFQLLSPLFSYRINFSCRLLCLFLNIPGVLLNVTNACKMSVTGSNL